MTPEQLKRNRENLDLSQAQIAAELEISERYWVYRESGVKPIPMWLSRAVRDLRNYPKHRP